MNYYVIESSTDGISLVEHSKQSLEEWLNDTKYHERVDGWIENNVHFLNAVTRSDPNNWGMGKYATILIIKGEIVVPKIKERIKEWKL